MEKTFTNYEIHGNLLGFILSEKTGYIQTQPGDRKLFFENGHLVFAKSSKKGENFADILVEMGKISDSELTGLKESLPSGESLGKALREKGFATPKDLGAALKHQIMRIITEVLMVPEGSTLVNEEPLPEKMPKLKISTLPLFVKNILLIDSPEFPPSIAEEQEVTKTEVYADLLERINLPDHFQPIFNEFESSLTTSHEAEGLDSQQFKKILYIFNILGMIELNEIKGDDPFDQLGLPDASLGLLEDGSEDVFGLEDPSDDEQLMEHQGVLELDDFNPLGDIDDDLPGEDEPPGFPESAIENSLLPEGAIEEPLPIDNSFEEDTIVAHPDEQTSIDSLSAEDDSPILDDLLEPESTDSIDPIEEEDPIEALNRALAGSEPQTLSMDLGEISDDHVLNDQSETVPGAPVIELTETLMESDPEPDQLYIDEAPTVPGEFTASDLEPSEPLPSPPTPEQEFFTPQPENETAKLSDENFILPDDEVDDLHYFDKKRNWSIILIPITIIILVICTFIFRDRIPFFKTTTPVTMEEGSNTSVSETTESIEPAGNEVPTDNDLADDDLASSLSAESNITEGKSITEDTEPVTQPLQESVEVQTEQPTPTEPPLAQPETQEPKPIEKEQPSEPAVSQAPAAQGQSIESLISSSRQSLEASNSPRYTLVFMVACQRETVEKLIVAHPDSSFYIVERLSNGTLCYCLTTGNFATYQEAKQATVNPPPGILEPGEKPWVLKIGK